MPLYEYTCQGCGAQIEKVQSIGEDAPFHCGAAMKRGAGSLAFIRIKGQGYPSRKKWMDNWTPDSKPMQIGSVHGEKY